MNKDWDKRLKTSSSSDNPLHLFHLLFIKLNIIFFHFYRSSFFNHPLFIDEFFFQESEEEADYVELINVLEEKVGYSLILCLPDTRMGSMFHLRFLFSDSFICDQAFYFGNAQLLAAQKSTFGIALVTLTLALLHHYSPPRKNARS